MKKEKQEQEQQKVEVENSRNQEELVPPPTPEPDVDPEEELELSAEGEEDTVDEKNEDIVRCGLVFYAFNIRMFLAVDMLLKKMKGRLKQHNLTPGQSLEARHTHTHTRLNLTSTCFKDITSKLNHTVSVSPL